MARELMHVYALLLSLLLFLCGCSPSTDPLLAFRQGNYSQAYKLWSLDAHAGNHVAQNCLGILYYLGLGVERDYTEAANWFQRAAKSGNADAQRNLGMLYFSGLGVAQDNLHAYAWFYAAAQHGNLKAHDYLEALVNKLTPNQIMQAREVVQDLLPKNSNITPENGRVLDLYHRN